MVPVMMNARTTLGMIRSSALRTWTLVLALLLVPGILLAGELNVFFSPDGGFSPWNKDRKVVLKSGERIAPIPNNALRDFIERTPRGGQIKICLYALASEPHMDMLLDAAFKRGIYVKVLLDGVAAWTTELRKTFKDKIAERARKVHPKIRKRFQLRMITHASMENGGRAVKSKEGDLIYGTMHEKFGIFYDPGNPFPKHGFFGSANVSYGSDHTFAESRFTFRDRPDIGAQFAEEFARLWNEYGECVAGPCQSERVIDVSAKPGDLEVLFNAESVSETKYVRIDKALANLIDRANRKGGSLDVAMFSFTRRWLAEMLVDVARHNPRVPVRVMMDQSQINEGSRGVPVIGPWIEEQAREHGLKNLQVRYKWRSNVYGWEEPEEEGGTPIGPGLVHFRSPLLHHKLVIVNKRWMGAGSYNWSGTAERRNFENLGIFDARRPDEKELVQRYISEFDAIWNSLRKPWPFREREWGCQMISGPEGRALEKKILAALAEPGRYEVMQAVEKARYATVGQVAKATGMPLKTVRSHLKALHDAELLVVVRKKGRAKWSLAD